MKILKILLVFLLINTFIYLPTIAQKKKIIESDYTNTEVEMADKMRADGKIYVVVAVMTTILTGLIVYTVLIDRKLTKIEREINSVKK